MKAILTREISTGTQTVGTLRLYDKENKYIEKMDTLEPAWRQNVKNISCIPKGTYQVVERESVKFGKHYHIQNVENRKLILIHAGNYTYQTQGCIIVGTGRGIKGNEIHMILSKMSLKRLHQAMKKQFTLIIE